MANNIVFFSVQADDLSRARRFYEQVFGWRFEPWGPPGVLLAFTGDKNDPGIPGALQKRHEVVPGTSMYGMEGTVGVPDIDAAANAIVAHGGKILFPKCEILGVGWILKFQDCEGNIFCAKQATDGANP
jgi:predicted enzyme related to lactoylglutathione lyase